MFYRRLGFEALGVIRAGRALLQCSRCCEARADPVWSSKLADSSANERDAIGGFAKVLGSSRSFRFLPLDNSADPSDGIHHALDCTVGRASCAAGVLDRWHNRNAGRPCDPAPGHRHPDAGSSLAPALHAGTRARLGRHRLRDRICRPVLRRLRRRDDTRRRNPKSRTLHSEGGDGDGHRGNAILCARFLRTDCRLRARSRSDSRPGERASRRAGDAIHFRNLCGPLRPRGGDERVGMRNWLLIRCGTDGLRARKGGGGAEPG